MMEPFIWLAQDITIPLYGFLLAFILPAGYFAKLAKTLIEKRFNGFEDK